MSRITEGAGDRDYKRKREGWRRQSTDDYHPACPLAYFLPKKVESPLAHHLLCALLPAFSREQIQQIDAEG